MDPTLLHTWAQAIKMAVADHYAAQGVALPAWQQVLAWTPAYDCEMVAVYPEAAFAHDGSMNATDTAAAMADPAHAMRYARIAIAVVRCVPTLDDNGNPPATTVAEAAALPILTDALLVWDAVVAAQRAGTIPTCGSVAFESWASVEANGGLGGGVTRIRCAVW